MDPSNWKQTKDALATAMELPVVARGEFLASLSAEIRADVKRLLAADESAESFINEPILVEQGVVTEDTETGAVEGQVIDGYRVIRKIGSGGMGAVYLADQSGEGFSQKVALKLIKRGMDTGAVLKRFLMERQILANLEHPNIARMLDGGSTSEGLPYFVMEYVDGEEIRDYCDRRKLGLDRRLQLFRKICDAVSNAHQKLVVHRDLKPSNILVTKDGEPKLLDFGIAKLTSPDWNADTNEATITQFRIMTPEYASPEQLAGEATATSTDIYSLGVVLYELLTGERPHITRGKTPKEIADSVLSSDPPKPSTVVLERSRNETEHTSFKKTDQTVVDPTKQTRSTAEVVEARSLQGDLDNIILKAMRREPERRYQSVQEFSDDIRRYLEGLPVNATADSRSYRFRKFVQRNKTAVLATSATALLLLTATAVTGWQYNVAQRERQMAEQRFNDTRTLAKSVLYELYDAIDAVPGSTKAKELLAAKALEYLDRLAAEGGNDPYLLSELADGYQRIGNIQGGYGQANLGQTAEAKVSYEKSFAIRKSIIDSGETDPKFKTKLALAYARMADADYLETDLQGYYENHTMALGLMIDSAASTGEDADTIYELAAAHINAGRGACVVNKFGEGIPLLVKGVEIFERLDKQYPENQQFRTGLIYSYDTLGEMHSAFGQKEEALNQFRKAKALVDETLQTLPNNVDALRFSAVVNTSIADAACDLGRYDEAMTSADIALQQARLLGANDEGNLDAEMLISLTIGNRGRVLARSGKWKEGIEALQTSRTTFAAVVESDPANKIAPFQLAGIDDELGRSYLDMALADLHPGGRRAALLKARPLLQRAYEVYKKYRDDGITVAEDAALTDEVAALLAKCDEAIALIR